MQLIEEPCCAADHVRGGSASAGRRRPGTTATRLLIHSPYGNRASYRAMIPHRVRCSLRVSADGAAAEGAGEAFRTEPVTTSPSAARSRSVTRRCRASASPGVPLQRRVFCDDRLRKLTRALMMRRTSLTSRTVSTSCAHRTGSIRRIALTAQFDVLPPPELESIESARDSFDAPSRSVFSSASVTSRHRPGAEPRPTRPRSWCSCETPNGRLLRSIIVEAFGTSTPTSMTVVATRMSMSPRENACIVVSFSCDNVFRAIAIRSPRMSGSSRSSAPAPRHPTSGPLRSPPSGSGASSAKPSGSSSTTFPLSSTSITEHTANTW